MTSAQKKAMNNIMFFFISVIGVLVVAYVAWLLTNTVNGSSISFAKSLNLFSIAGLS